MNSVTRTRFQYILCDYLLTAAGWLIFNVIRYYSLPLIYKTTLGGFLFLDSRVVAGQILVPLMMVAIYALSGFYNNVQFRSRFDDLGNTAACSLIGMLIIFFTILVNDDIPERLQNYEMMAILWGLLFLPVYIERTIITLRIRRRVLSGEHLMPALIIGTGKDTRRMITRLKRPRVVNMFRPVGIISTDDDRVRDIDGLPVYPLAQLNTAISDTNAMAIIVPGQGLGMTPTLDMLSTLYRTDLQIFLTPDLYQLITSRARFDTVVGEPLVNITNANISPLTNNLKRLGDIMASSMALLVLWPLFAVLAIIIKRDSPGPVFYRQTRIGYHKRPFKIIKFRSMRVDAESTGPTLSTTDDPRVTRIGRFLRKYRLDELPQFWNVLVGEMSLVGPRPERDYYIRQIVERVPYYSMIHQVRPGITSWGMVKYGYASTVDEMIERLRYDLLYIENVSFGLDVKILFHTINTVATGKGV